MSYTRPKVVSARLTPDELVRLDRLRDQLAALVPGVPITDSAVLKHCLASVVSAMPAGDAPPGTLFDGVGPPRDPARRQVRRKSKAAAVAA